MLLIQIDVVHVEALQAGFHTPNDALRPAFLWHSDVFVQELAGEHDIRTMTPEPLHGLTDELFGLPAAIPGADTVFLCGVEKIDAGIKRGGDDTSRVFEVALVTEKISAKVVGTQANH